MAAPRALYACDPDRSRGRLFAEPPSKTRSPFRRDCDRVIHSTAFRRLKHKTQVFVFHEGDHYRTRLTHSLEVAQIARALARQLGLDEDLTETLALAHDLGHPPFGHAGERALDKCLQAHGGFDHNAQTLQLVTSLEHRYPDFDGLNLTWESLEGIVKHNGPLTERGGAPVGGKGDIPVGIADFNRKLDLELWSFASLEAQVAAFADDIAYDAHDIDDGLRAGLFAVDDLKVMPLTEAIIADIGKHYPDLDDVRRGAELVRELISYLIGAVVAETQQAAGGRQAAIGPRRSPLPSADGRVSAAGGAGGGRDQGIPLAADVPPCAGDAGDGGGGRDPVRPVRALPGLAGRPAGRMGRRHGAGKRGRAGAPDRQFHCRDDRPFRPDGAPKAF